MLRQVVGTVLDKPEQLNALAKMDEAQREAPDLAGHRMRYPGSASRAVLEAAPSTWQLAGLRIGSRAGSRRG